MAAHLRNRLGRQEFTLVDNNKAPTSVLNEQVFNLWSLQEMVYLSRIRGEDPSPWQKEFDAAREAVRTKRGMLKPNVIGTSI